MSIFRVAGLLLLLTAFAVFFFSAGTANAVLMETFDPPGGTPYTLTNSSGSAPAITGATSPTGNYVRLTNLDGSNNNSIAFDENPAQTGPAPAGVKLAFNFRMTGDQDNADAGGCCGSAADGFGIGLYSTATYGATGAANPAAGGAAWERPAHPDAFAIGFDVFQNIDEISLNWGGAEVAVANVQPFLDLNSNEFHRALVSITPSGGDAVVDMDIIEDVMGATVMHSVFSGQTIAGLDLASLPNYRLIAGGRTGGAFMASDLDNIYLANIPEPSSVMLTLAGLIGLAFVCRRNRK